MAVSAIELQLLGRRTIIEHDDSIVVDDRVEAVRDGEHGAFFESHAHHLLDLSIRLDVD